ncbi:hypothetical protein GALMADRAFT_145412 [Galerina marginata CBS 339.88]|uniref:Uncharacterized protein n=1 Tax=Galerina marginata (strain CBS 339.88) TaxID=685588 RepID=A0A067SPS7_GALM3|nr:hypothetical protein GALMADRAFT_145412 [Galerina marginata CBS 339.88]
MSARLPGYLPLALGFNPIAPAKYAYHLLRWIMDCEPTRFLEIIDELSIVRLGRRLDAWPTRSPLPLSVASASPLVSYCLLCAASWEVEPRKKQSFLRMEIVEAFF